MSGEAFIEHFSAVEDPRQAWKVVYPLPEILLLIGLPPGKWSSLK